MDLERKANSSLQGGMMAGLAWQTNKISQAFPTLERAIKLAVSL